MSYSKRFPPQMHMRKQAEQRGVVRQRALHFHPKVIRAGRNDEGVIVELQSENALPRAASSQTPVRRWSGRFPAVPFVV